MKTLCSWNNRIRGFALLEILGVVVIIAILAGWYFRSPLESQKEAASQYQQSMDRGNQTACLASRTALRTAIQMHMMQNPGKTPTKEELGRAGINLNVCPEQGDIQIAQDGNLTCTKHAN